MEVWTLILQAVTKWNGRVGAEKRHCERFGWNQSIGIRIVAVGEDSGEIVRLDLEPCVADQQEM